MPTITEFASRKLRNDRHEESRDGRRPSNREGVTRRERLANTVLVIDLDRSDITLEIRRPRVTQLIAGNWSNAKPILAEMHGDTVKVAKSEAKRS